MKLKWLLLAGTILLEVEVDHAGMENGETVREIPSVK